MRVTLTGVSDPELIAPVWQDIEARSEHSYFISWSWIGTWLRMIPKDVRPILMQAADGDRVVGLAVLAPRDVVRHRLVRSRSLYLHETGDSEIDELTMEFNGILSERGREKEVVAACLNYLMGEINDWDEIVLNGVERSGSLTEFHCSGANLEIKKSSPVYFVDLKSLRDNNADYRAVASKKTQYYLRRAMREYGKAGELTPTVAEDLRQAEQFLEGLKQLHQARWTAAGMPGSFGNAFFCRFHEELVRTRFQTGEIQLFRVTAGDQTVGYLYNFVYRGHVYHYQAGIDYNTWSTSASRPGFICHYFAIEQNRLRGANVYDLMEGDSRYKSELGTQSTMMYWMVLQRNRPRFRVERGLKRFVKSFRSGEPQVETGTSVE